MKAHFVIHFLFVLFYLFLQFASLVLAQVIFNTHSIKDCNFGFGTAMRDFME